MTQKAELTNVTYVEKHIYLDQHCLNMSNPNTKINQQHTKEVVVGLENVKLTNRFNRKSTDFKTFLIIQIEEEMKVLVIHMQIPVQFQLASII